MFMKKLVALFLSLSLSLMVIPALAGDEPVAQNDEVYIVDKNWMAEQIATIVGYTPYVVELDAMSDEEREYAFIMADGEILHYVMGESFDDFVMSTEDYAYAWYSELPEKVSMTHDEQLVVGMDKESCQFYLDTFFYEPGSNLVLGYNGYNLWLFAEAEEYEETEDGRYIFNREYLAQLVYEDEMSHLLYVADLLNEVR